MDKSFLNMFVPVKPVFQLFHCKEPKREQMQDCVS